MFLFIVIITITFVLQIKQKHCTVVKLCGTNYITLHFNVIVNNMNIVCLHYVLPCCASAALMCRCDLIC